MIEIRTNTGVSLDIAPDMEFELIMENPILADEHIPTPFSTSISFPPSHKNKGVFGYVDALMLQPSVMEIGATIFSSGIPVISGTLIFDSVDEDKNLCYAFNGVDYTEQWKGKLYEIQDILTGEYNSDQIKSGIYEDVKAPRMIASGYEAKTGLEPTTVNEHTVVASVPKFFNAGTHSPRSQSNADTRFLPAVSLSLLTKRILGDSAAAALADAIDGLYIIGTHRDGNNAVYMQPDIGSFLPDISKADFIREVCKLAAAGVFKDGNGVRVVKAKDILLDTDFLDWSDLISDIFSQQREDAEGYKFGFMESGNRSEIPEITDDGTGESIQTVESLSDLVTLPDEESYKLFLYGRTEDIYSEKLETFNYYVERTPGHYIEVTYKEILADKIMDTTKNIDIPGDSQHDNTVRFERVRCAPSWIVRSDEQPRMMPIVDVPEINADRAATTYIGAIIRNQFCDRGCVFSGVSTDEYVEPGKSLDPERFFLLYHEEISDWFRKSRQTIKADVSLSATDIASFRMWKKVLIKHRPFLVKQLNIRFSASSGIAFVTGEFVSI